MSLTATTSMSASDSCAARNTLRPIRPNPLIPTRTGISVLPEFVVSRRAGRLPGPAQRQPVDVPVLDLDEVLVAISEGRSEVLGDGDRAVAAARAADRDH